MALPDGLAKVRATPGMYLPHVSYPAVTAFILGYDEAMGGGLLVGYREWLIVRLGDGNNLSWPPLVSMIFEGVRAEVADVPEEVAAIDFLFETIEQFLVARSAVDGLRRIYFAYETWLRQQDWYDPAQGLGASVAPSGVGDGPK